VFLYNDSGERLIFFKLRFNILNKWERMEVCDKEIYEEIKEMVFVVK